MPYSLENSMQRLKNSLFTMIATLSVAILLGTFAGCSSTLELSSGWTDQELRITGDETHWRDATSAIAGPDVQVGVKNDAGNLYVALITANRFTQMQILALGCTVWFDKDGTKSKKSGIQFPVSGLMQGRRFSGRENPEELQRLVDAAQRQFEIVGPGDGERHRISERDGKGVEVHLGLVDGTLTYELKIPLQRTESHPYAVNTDVSKPLNLCFETGDVATAMRGQPSTSSPSQAAGGGRGRSGGRSGGGGGASTPAGGMGADVPEPLKHWMTVHLASGPAVK
jgi:uncharacterized membrane protein YgcG